MAQGRASNQAMIVLVCGGRDYTDRANVNAWLTMLFQPDYGPSEDAQPWWLPRPDLKLIFGGANGVDSFALDWAVVNWVRFEEYAADWLQHGKAAGPIRNQLMLDEGKPDLVVAFPGGKGTAAMVSRAKKAGVAVLEIPQ